MRILPLMVIAVVALSLGACSTSRNLPGYEPPLAKTNFQHVRTTAYTDSEADHEEYGNRTALGGVLHAAAPATPVPRAIPVTQRDERPGPNDYRSVAFVRVSQPFRSTNFSAPIYASVSADWSRWP